MNMWSSTRFWFLLFFTADLLSFGGYYFPDIQPWLFVIAGLAYLTLAFYSLPSAMLVTLAELFVGSHGYLFSIEFSGVQISIRLAFFLVLMSVSIWHFIKRIKEKELLFRVKASSSVIFLGAVVLFALGRGLLMGYGFEEIFFDVNAYFFLGLALPLLVIGRNKSFYKLALRLLVVAGSYLAIKTLLILYFFTHSYYRFFVPDLYMWLRDNRIGEFTPTLTGAYRVFMASQIYLLIAWWIVFWRSIVEPIWKRIPQVLYLGLMASALIVSFSRSFWLGWILSIGALLFWLLVTKQWVAIIRSIALVFVGVAMGFLFIVLTLQFPLPKVTEPVRFDLEERFGIEDAAASSRWNLLPPLWRAVEEHLVLGSGFGSAVTYISNDPRVRASSPMGLYTTTAFEWGYLDMWLKLGAMGVLAYALVVWTILKKAYFASRFKDKNFGLLVGLVAVLGVHIGSPYLNHPLGLGFLLLLFGLYIFYPLTFYDQRVIK